MIKVLNYHHVHDGPDPSFRVTPAQFRAQMRCLLEEGFHILDLAQTVQIVNGDRPVKKAVLIAFDDGYEDFLNAWSILKSMNIPCVVFLISGFLGLWNEWDPLRKTRHKHLTLAQLRGLRDEGLHFGSHSRSHPVLTRLNPLRLWREVRGSRRDLEAALGVSIPVFAYPGGHVNQLVQALTAWTYAAGFATGNKAGASPGQPHRIPRLEASLCGSLDAFRDWLRTS
jgi:peptidoglycan/xylan/chitin deacetylase (PgdA/CDA1 family)